MKGTRYCEEQIIAILKQGEAGVATAELCRQHRISGQTYYRWKANAFGWQHRCHWKMQNAWFDRMWIRHRGGWPLRSSGDDKESTVRPLGEALRVLFSMRPRP